MLCSGNCEIIRSHFVRAKFGLNVICATYATILSTICECSTEIYHLRYLISFFLFSFFGSILQRKKTLKNQRIKLRSTPPIIAIATPSSWKIRKKKKERKKRWGGGADTQGRMIIRPITSSNRFFRRFREFAGVTRSSLIRGPEEHGLRDRCHPLTC